MSDQIMRSLGRIEANQETLKEDMAGLRGDLGSVRSRVQHLESFRNWITGVGAALLAVIGWISKGG